MTNESWYDEHPAWPNGKRPDDRLFRPFLLFLLLLCSAAALLFGLGACQDDDPERFEAMEVVG